MITEFMRVAVMLAVALSFARSFSSDREMLQNFKHALKRCQVSLALLLSLASVVYLESSGINGLHWVAMFFCGIICLIKFEGFKPVPVPLPLDGYEINHAIGYLFTLRIIIDGLQIMGNISIWGCWLITTILLSLQLILALGGGLGYGSRINTSIANVKRSINAYIL